MLHIIFSIINWFSNSKGYGSIIVKLIIVFLLGTMVVSSIGITWGIYTEDVVWENDEARHLGYCKRYLNEKQYGHLWEQLELYDLYDEKYQEYWDAIEEQVEQIEEQNVIKANSR